MLQQASLFGGFVLTQYYPKHYLCVVLTAFGRSLDADGNGQITAVELETKLRQVNLPCTSERDVGRMMGMLDTDGNRSISYEEFRNFACLLPHSQVRAHTHTLTCEAEGLCGRGPWRGGAYDGHARRRRQLFHFVRRVQALCLLAASLTEMCMCVCGKGGGRAIPMGRE